MSDHKHTPGPWMANGKYVVAAGYVDTYSGVVWGTIAVCEETNQQDPEGRSWATGGDAPGNARLIAAAPDLLDVLIKARAELEAYELEATGEGYNNPALNAAISKATGEA